MRPLSGVRVLDLSRLLPGPFATAVLADMGATVDKVEDPHGGDYLRIIPPQIAGENAAFGLLNRGKRSAVIDLKDRRGADLLKEMLPSYDIVFEQFRPGVMDRLGLGPKQLIEAQPRLIVCSLTGYGQTGPLALKAGHDLNYLARAGVLGAQGPAGETPALPGFQLADVSGGLWSVIAILGALRERDRSGKGAHLDIAMSEGTIPFATMSFGAALAGQAGDRGDEVLTGGIAPYSTYRTRDDRALSLAALEPKFWQAFAREIGLEPAFEDVLPGPHQAALKGKVAAVLATRTLAEWTAYFSEKDCLVEPVLTPTEAITDAHLRERGVFFEIPTARGPSAQIRTPVTPRDEEFRPAPASGENTREICLESGIDEKKLDELLAAKVIR